MSNITDLPFVADIGKGKKKTRTFWNIHPNGNFQDEYLLGQSYARVAISYMREHGLSLILGRITSDMGKQEKRSGIEIGFMAGIAQYAIYGAKQAGEI